MTVQAATGLRPVLDCALEARAENLEQTALLWDPSPECDSLIEYIARLVALGADIGIMADLTALVRRIAESNEREGGHEQTIAGVLDRVTRELHVAGVRSALSAKAAARALRPALATIAGQPDGPAFFRAACAVRDVADELDDSVLRGPGLRNALGAGRHDLLLSLIDAARGSR